MRAVVRLAPATRPSAPAGTAGRHGTPFTIDVADRYYVAALLKRMDACRLPLIACASRAVLPAVSASSAPAPVVARDDALLGVSEVNVGCFDDDPALSLRAPPYRTMMEMCLSGEPKERRRRGHHQLCGAARELDLDCMASSASQPSPTGIRLGKQAPRSAKCRPTAR